MYAINDSVKQSKSFLGRPSFVDVRVNSKTKLARQDQDIAKNVLRQDFTSAAERNVG